MIIEKIRIKSFGKLKNKDLNLKPGINIIYGENEKGKSTIQGFIKVM
ncbi:ATP-binding protein, partial [Clostridium polynesiense]